MSIRRLNEWLDQTKLYAWIEYTLGVYMLTYALAHGLSSHSVFQGGAVHSAGWGLTGALMLASGAWDWSYRVKENFMGQYRSLLLALTLRIRRR